MASYRWLDRNACYSPSGRGFSVVYVPPTANVISPEVLADPTEAPLGSLVHEKGFLLDRAWAGDDAGRESAEAGAEEGADPGGAPLEWFWMRRGPQNQWRLYREDQSGEAEQPASALAVSEQSSAASVRFTGRGVRRNLDFSGKTSLLLSLPAATYDGAVSDYLLRNESFSAYGVTRIPEASWQWMLAQLSDQEKTLFDSCYVAEDTVRRLLNTVSADDYAAILKKVHALTHRDGTIFASLPQDPQPSKRIVLLSASEYSSLLSGVDAALPGVLLLFP